MKLNFKLDKLTSNIDEPSSNTQVEVSTSNLKIKFQLQFNISTSNLNINFKLQTNTIVWLDSLPKEIFI